MAIYHLSMKPISRSSGRSAVAAAAYRAGALLKNERDGLTHDFTRRSGVEQVEIVLPGDAISKTGELVRGAGPAWARVRSALWNAAERAEKRKDARVAQEIELALPHELAAGQRLALVREFCCELAGRYGVAVDFALHSPHGQTDSRNHHAHIMLTTRQVVAVSAAAPLGLGEKARLEWENKKLKALGLPSGPEQVRELRMAWDGMANVHLARAGLDVRIDHRSHEERGLEIAPTRHMGVLAPALARRGEAVTRTGLDEETDRLNAELIRENPEQILSLITGEKSVFDQRDIARALHRAVDWQMAARPTAPAAETALGLPVGGMRAAAAAHPPGQGKPGVAAGMAGGDETGSTVAAPVAGEAAGAVLFAAALARVMASSALVELQPERRDEQGRVLAPARYSTREMVAIEGEMAAQATRLAANHSFGVRAAALARQEAAIRQAGGRGLSREQREAIEYLVGPEGIKLEVGLAGTGKSTSLRAAREIWEAEGFTVRWAALSGKAAEGLEESAGLTARTLAAWERRWARGRDLLGPRDVFVIDEAGMVGSRQLARFIQAAALAGAKIVLVGDPEQLQPIGPGAAFRAVAERVGFVTLAGVRRQREEWQCAASVDFGRQRTAAGLAAYEEHGCIRFTDTGEAARAAIVADVLADMAARPEGSRLVLAQRNTEVRALNEAIRAGRQARGELAGEVVLSTSEGKRAFAPGDRVLFRENNRDLGVKNGMLGTVVRVSAGDAADGAADDGRDGPCLVVRLDDGSGPGRGREVSVPLAEYAAVDHGYATTIHKAQGATVDRAYVLASATMDRHLTYVAMTRHRDGVQLYAARSEFRGRQGGVLVAHGPAPYAHKPGNRQSYYAVLERGGERQTVWGVDLGRAIADAGAQVGDMIALEVTGTEMVRLPDGTPAERHNWRVRDADELARARLVSQLSRSGAKETTLDYAPGRAPGTEREQGQAKDLRGESIRFAARRGLDMTSAIILPEQMAASVAPAQAPEVSTGVPAQPRPREQARGQPAGPGVEASQAPAPPGSGPAAPPLAPPAQPEAGRGLDAAAIAAGRAAFRARYAAWQAEIAAAAHGLVKLWRELLGGYRQALKRGRQDELAAARARLHGFAAELEARQEAVRQLRARPEEFGITGKRVLTQVLAARAPEQVLLRLTTAVEAERQEKLRQQAATEAIPRQEKDDWSDEPGLGM